MEPMPPEKLARFCQLALDRLALGNYEGARPYLQAASSGTDAPPPLLLRLQGVCAAGLDTFAEALPLLEAALDGFRLDEDVAGEVAVAGDLAAVLQRQGNLSRAAVLITWALDYTQHVDQVQHVWLLNIAASIATLQGRLDEALCLLHRARPLASEQFSAWIDLHIAATLDSCNRHAEAGDYIEAAQQPLISGDLVTKALLATTRTWHALLRGDVPQAYQESQRTLHYTTIDQHPLLASSLLAIRGVLARETGKFDQAEQLLGQALDAMHTQYDHAGILGVRWHQAVLAWQCSENQIAFMQLDQILQQMQAGGYGTTLLWQPLRFGELCQWARAEGAQNQHLDWLLDHVLAPWHTTISADQPSSAALTQREQDVVAALTQGLTDREIATHLQISERTVQNHLQHIYDKLGVRGRTAVVSVVSTKDAVAAFEIFD